jgi:hypothetical protein
VQITHWNSSYANNRRQFWPESQLEARHFWQEKVRECNTQDLHMYHFGMLIFEMKNQLTEHVARKGARQDGG